SLTSSLYISLSSIESEVVLASVPVTSFFFSDNLCFSFFSVLSSFSPALTLLFLLSASLLLLVSLPQADKPIISNTTDKNNIVFFIMYPPFLNIHIYNPNNGTFYDHILLWLFNLY